MARKPINAVIVISDTHAGCQLALCDPKKTTLDNGGGYSPSPLQKKLWRMWREFWDQWVPMVTHGQPFAIVHNGDALDGVHHKATSQISHNLADQAKIAYEILAPVVELAGGRYYHIRGTEAHVGPSGEQEELLARSLGAVPDEHGLHARYELWMEVGKGLVHFMHHIGTTGSSHYESTAVTKELTESYTEAGRWNLRPPDVVVRSHRHRHIKISVPTDIGEGISEVTPGWQLKTPFVYKIPGGRVTTPQIGGIAIIQGDEDLYTRSKVWSIGRPKAVKL